MAKPLDTEFSAMAYCGAAEEWGCNCGPGAIAAMLGLTLADVRPLLGDFEKKGYTNIKLMDATLARLGEYLPFKVEAMPAPLTWPDYGLCRIQWHGPWMHDDFDGHWSVRQRATHWVGSCIRYGHQLDEHMPTDIGIFDINQIGNETGWASLKNWGEITVPWLLNECEPESDGMWSITHVRRIILDGPEMWHVYVRSMRRRLAAA